MKKNILSEINRNREIMGLGQLLREQEVSAKDLKIWFTSEGSDNLGTIKNLVGKLQKTNLVNAKIAGVTVWEAINTAFTKITGKSIIGDDGKGTKTAFSNGQWINRLFKHGTQNSPKGFVMLGGGKLRVSSTELGISGEDEMTINELISRINAYNVKFAGSKQLIRAGKLSQYESSGNENGIYSKKEKGQLYLWSTTDKVEKRDVTKDETIPGKDVAGDVLKVSLDDSYENLQIVVSDDSKVNGIKEKMKSHVAQGGKIDNILITSTASNTGLKPEGLEDFAKMMKDNGLAEYANVSTDKGTTGDFTIDQVDTTDRALAVARGKILAKQLGIESNVTYKFSITNGPKTVDISVQGTSPTKPGEDVKIDGSISDEEQITEKSGDVIYPTVLLITIKKAGFIQKVGNIAGTSRGSKRVKRA